MPEPFRYRRRVEFRDTDAAGIVHFSVFFTYMEAAEHALLRDVGLGVHMRDDEGRISWPRVSSRCDYQVPLRFEDEVEIEVRLTRLGPKSATYAFRFLLDGQVAAIGETTAVCCRLLPDDRPRSIPMPDWIRDKLAPLLAE